MSQERQDNCWGYLLVQININYLLFEFENEKNTYRYPYVTHIAFGLHHALLLTIWCLRHLHRWWLRNVQRCREVHWNNELPTSKSDLKNMIISNIGGMCFRLRIRPLDIVPWMSYEATLFGRLTSVSLLVVICTAEWKVIFYIDPRLPRMQSRRCGDERQIEILVSKLIIPDDRLATDSDAQLRQTMQHCLTLVSSSQGEDHLIIVAGFVANPHHVFYLQLF